MRLLVLDLATHTGFAFGGADGLVEHGSHALPSTGDDIGTFLDAFRDWLVDTAIRLDPTEIAFESPILPKTTNIHTCRKLYSLCGLTELLAHRRRIGCREANLMDIRRHFIGRPGAPRDIPQKERRKWVKDAVDMECRRRGLRPADDNAADALALFSYVMSVRCPGFILAGDEIARAA